MNVFVIIAIVAVALLTIAEKFVARNIEQKLNYFLYNKDFKSYDKLRNQFVTKYLFNPFNLKFSDLNRYGIEGNIEKFEETIHEFNQMRLNKNQKEAVYTKAFYYFMMKKDLENADRYYHYLKDLDRPEIMGNIEVFHDTFIEKGHTYLEQTLTALENANEVEKADLESIIAQMYDNMGDKEKAMQYTDLAEKHFTEMEKQISEMNAQEK